MLDFLDEVGDEIDEDITPDEIEIEENDIEELEQYLDDQYDEATTEEEKEYLNQLQAIVNAYEEDEFSDNDELSKLL